MHSHCDAGRRTKATKARILNTKEFKHSRLTHGEKQPAVTNSVSGKAATTARIVSENHVGPRHPCASDLVNAVAGGVDGAQQLQVLSGLAQTPQSLEDRLHSRVGSLHAQLLRRVTP